jgi:hypothetical protein
VDNGLKNLKRDKYLRTTPPCKSDCEFLHGNEQVNTGLGIVCKRWVRFQKNLDRKKKVMNPCSISRVGDIKDTKFVDELEIKDLQSHVYHLMDEELRDAFLLLIGGNQKKVSKENKKRIQEFFKDIMG